MNRFKNLPDNPVTVLIRPPISRWKLYKWYSPFGSHEPTLGLLYIASYLQSNGFDVHIIDGELLNNKELDEALKNIKPDIIGITTTTFSFFNAAYLATQLRYQLPGCLLLLGGPHASALPLDSLIRISCLDGIVIGEGEETILEIVQKRDTQEINGLIWKENIESQIITNKPREPVTNLDKYKLNWNLLNGFPKRYSPPFQSKRKNSASLVVSRGCFYDCSFCAGALLWGKKIRYHSPEYVVNLMIELKFSYSITDFYFHDDYFTAHPLWIKRFCNLLIEQKRCFSWSCASRVEVLNNEILNLMKKSGCRQIGIGVESGSQYILDKLSKGISIPALRDGLNRISLANIDIKGYFVLNAPGESISDLYKTLKLILASKFSDIQLNYYAPLPGSSDYYKYNPSDKLWNKMSLQHCLGYSKIHQLLYPLIEVCLYIISYLKIFFSGVISKSDKFG